MATKEYAIISDNGVGGVYVSGFRVLEVSAWAQLPVNKKADLRAVTRTDAAFDPATEKLGPPSILIESNKVTITRAAVALSQGELDAVAAAAIAPVLDIAAKRAAILQAIADGQLPANHPLPEYP